jgi:hypothetical protein
MTERTFWETIEFKGGQLLEKLKEVVEQGNVRRVRIRNKGRTVAEFPLTAGVVGALLAPIAAAIGVLVALLQDCAIDVERTTDEESAPPPVEPPRVEAP